MRVQSTARELVNVPHRGRDLGTDPWFDQNVVYVEIIQDSAADILTAR